MRATDRPVVRTSPADSESQDHGELALIHTTAFIEALRRSGGRSAADSLASLLRLAMLTGDWDGAGAVSITTAGRLRVAAGIGAAEDLDAAQRDVMQGPAFDAHRAQALVTVRDVSSERRWEHWAPVAAAAGVRCCVAVPLYTDRPLGALMLYSYRPRGLEDPAVQYIAAHASLLLAHALEERHLWAAIDSRHLIGQAQGILTERLGLTSESAFALLERLSQDSNTKIADLAQQLITTGHTPNLTAPDRDTRAGRIRSSRRRSTPGPGPGPGGDRTEKTC